MKDKSKQKSREGKAGAAGAPPEESGGKAGTRKIDRVAVLVLEPGDAPSLNVQATPEEERTFRVHKERLVIGSVVSADVRLSGDGVAPIHAVIEIVQGPVKGGGVATVYDLASETGVFVNGEKSVTRSLKQGDRIRIGTSTLRFSVDDVKAYSSKGILRDPSGRRLLIDPREDLAPLILEDERLVEEIFDYRPASKQALEVVMSWKGAILDVAHFVNEKMVTVGNAPKCNFSIPPLLSSARFPIVTRGPDGGMVLNLDMQMGGVMQKSGELRKIADVRNDAPHGPYGFQIPLSSDDFAKVSIGEIDLYLSFTAAPPRMRRGRLFERDPLFFRIFSSSMVFTAVMMFALHNVKVPQNIEAEQLPERIARILYHPEKFAYYPKRYRPQQQQVVAEKTKTPPKKTTDAAPPPPKKTVTQLNIEKPKARVTKPVPKEMDTGSTAKKAPTGGPAKGSSVRQGVAREGEGAKAKGTSGRRGSKAAAPSSRSQAKATRPSASGGTGSGGSRSQVPGIGNVDFLKGAGQRIQNLLSSGSEKLGRSGSKIKGFGGFDTQGSGGLALSGEGTGGGGAAETLGGLGEKGVGGGRVGTGLGAAGSGTGIVGGKTRVEIRSGGPEESIVMGSIDADAVEAALLAERDRFRLCYEREMNAGSPDLSGRVGTSFVIGPRGMVTRAGIVTSSLNNAKAERCIIDVIKTIQFPIPRGGGIVQVKYPFKFSKVGT